MRAGWFAAPGRPTKTGEMRPVSRCGGCGEMVPVGAPARRLITGATRCEQCAHRLLGETPPPTVEDALRAPIVAAPDSQPTVAPPPPQPPPQPEPQPLPLDYRQRQTGDDDA